MTEGVIEVFVALAFMLLLATFAVLYVVERMARGEKEPLADPGPGRTALFAGTIVPMGGYAVALVDPRPAEPDPPVDAESRLVAALIAGELDRSQYQERMAGLAAADDTTRPVRLPPEPA